MMKILNHRGVETNLVSMQSTNGHGIRRLRAKARSLTNRLFWEELETRQLLTGFTGYNEYSIGPNSVANVTHFAEGLEGQAASGQLVDFATGNLTNVLLSVSQVGSSRSGSGSAPAAGTNAAQVFGGIIDFLAPYRTIDLPQNSEYVYTLEGLDPGATYEFVGTSIRGSAATDRWTLVELEGADGFVSAHSQGIGVVTTGLRPNQVAIWTGNNARADQGFVAQWTDIDPGDDGTVQVVSTQYTGAIPTEIDGEGVANGLRGYGLTAIRVKELAATSPPVLDVGRVVQLRPTEVMVAATILNSGGERPRGKVYFGKSDGGIDPARWDMVVDAVREGNSLSYAFNGLETRTQYYVRFSAENSLGTTWSNASLLLTTPTLGPAAVKITPVTSIGPFSASLSGEIVQTGNDPPRLTLVLGTSDGGQDLTQWERQIDLGVLGKIDPQSTPFASTVRNLIPDMKYYYAVMAQNAFGTVWTSSESFRTDVVAPLLINEFLSSNGRNYTTRLRQFEGGPLGDTITPDWIELYNTSKEPLDVGGYHLTNDRSEPALWKFPAETTIPAQSYLLVFASGENVLNRTLDERQNLHTNFRLESTAGEFLALTDPEGETLFAFEDLPQQSQDISYGLENFDIARLFPAPTPGQNNANDTPAPPTLSLGSQTFQNPLTLEITAAHPSHVIYYTIDETTPTTNSLRYSSPLTISGTTRIRAIAVGPNGKTSVGVSSSFVRLDSSVVNRTSDLPLLIVETFGDGISGTFQDAFFGLVEPGADRLSRLTEPFDLETLAGIHVRGSSSFGFSKKQYRVEFRDEQGQDRKLPLLGMPREADWVLYGPGVYDRALISNPLMYELSNQIGRYAPRTRWVEAYLDSGGNGVSAADYVGVYAFIEIVEVDDDRVQIEPLTGGTGGRPVEGGFIWKNDRGSPYVEPENPNSAQSTYIQSWIDNLTAASGASHFKDPVRGYAKYADVDSFIDHNLLNLLAMNVDALRLSSYYFKTANGKLEAGPIWDFDRALDSTDGRDDNPRSWFGTGDSTRYFNDDSRTMIWWANMFRDPDFTQQYIDRWFELRKTVFSETELFATIDAVAAPIRNAAARDYAKWSGPRYSNFAGEIAHMKDWLKQRMSWIDSQWIAPPNVQVASGPTGERTITVTATGNAYYTLDGTDPRGEDGVLNPKAITIQGPITVQNSVNLVTRIFTPGAGRRNGYVETGDDWSPPVRIDVLVEPLATAADIAISEINYHPYDPAPNSPESVWGEDEFEFVELTNIAPFAINLDGLKFVETAVGSAAEGIQFVFAPQVLAPRESIVVVENRDAFEARYGTIPRIALGTAPQGNVSGEYGGRLANSGEQLTLLDRNNQTLRLFTWDDAWYNTTDGNGSSLELAQMWMTSEADLERPDRWRGSTQRGGTPGVPYRVGDLNGDGGVSSLDLDALFAQLSLPTRSRWFDLNEDQSVDRDDETYLTETVLDTRTGDVNLDGKVAFDDFLILAQNFGRADVSWKEGDLDGDHIVSFSDFLALSTHFGFMRPPARQR